MMVIVLYATKTLIKLNKMEIRLACQCHCLAVTNFVQDVGKDIYPKKSIAKVVFV